MSSIIQALKQPGEHLSDDVVDELEELHSDFVSLTRVVNRNIKAGIDEETGVSEWAHTARGGTENCQY